LKIFSVKNQLAYCSVPKDLDRIKNKVALNMTKRQLICFGTAAVIGIPIYLFTRGTIGNSPAVLLMMATMAPLFLLAMYEKDGQPAEKVLRNYIRATFFWPGIRPYRTENFYETLSEGNEVMNIAQNDKGAKQAPKSKYSGSKGRPQSRR